jgi:radical SAM superfamily enzyme YgiQ (UPF0313 family)
MRILLINSPFKVKISKDSRWPEYTKSGTLYYPFWLAYATAVIMEKGEHKPLLIDAIAKKMSFEESIKKAKKFSPDLVVIETSTPTAHTDVKFAEMIKEELGKDVKTALSGTLASSRPFDLIRMSESIDFVIRGEYDFTVNELATALENGEDIKRVLGLTYRSNGSIYNTPPRPLVADLDSIPFVSKAYKKFLNVFDYRYALARYPMVQIWTSRGCPARCTFCQYPQTFTMHLFRERSPKNVVDEMEYIIENLPAVKEIFFEDDSLPYDEKILIFDGKHVKMEMIGKIVDEAIKLSKKAKNIFGREFTKENPKKLCVVSFDPRTLKTNVYPISGFIRHKTKKKIYRIKLTEGREVRVSQDHSIFIYKNGRIMAAKVSDLKEGDFIAVPKRINLPEIDLKEINLVEEFLEKLPDEYLKKIYIKGNISELVSNYHETIKSVMKNLGYKYPCSKRIKSLNLLIVKNLPFEFCSKENIEKYQIYLATRNKKERIKPIIHVDEKFLWLLGAVVGDGSVSENEKTSIITLSLGDMGLNKKGYEIFKEYFGISGKIRVDKRYGNSTLYISNKILRYLFAEIFEIKSPARNKKFPCFVFTLPKEKKISFLKGFFDAEGMKDKTRNDVCFVTSSEALANDFMYLLLSLGEKPVCWLRKHQRNEKKYQNYILRVSVPAIEYIGTQTSYNNKRYLPFGDVMSSIDRELHVLSPSSRHNYLNLGYSPTYSTMSRFIESVDLENDYIDVIKKFLESDITFEKIREIKEISFDEEYVYDIEVHPNNQEVDNFVGGFGGVFLHNTFTINQKRVLEICKEIKDRGLHESGVVWSCNVRVQTKYETLKAMKDAGCRIVIVGYESGNDQVLSNIRKGATVREAKRFTIDAKRAGLRIFGCFMIGLPGDTRDSIMDTLKLAKELNPDMAFFQQAVPFPGTEFYEWAKMNGYLVTEDWSQWLDSNGRLRCLVSYPWLKAEEIDKLRDKLMIEFYTNPKHIAQTIVKNLHPLEASRVVAYAVEYLKYLIKRKVNPDGVAQQNFVGDNSIS